MDRDILPKMLLFSAKYAIIHHILDTFPKFQPLSRSEMHKPLGDEKVKKTTDFLDFPKNDTFLGFFGPTF